MTEVTEFSNSVSATAPITLVRACTRIADDNHHLRIPILLPSKHIDDF